MIIPISQKMKLRHRELHSEGGGDLTRGFAVGMVQAEKGRSAVGRGSSMAKAQSLEGTWGFLGASRFWQEWRGKIPGLRSLAGPEDPVRDVDFG